MASVGISPCSDNSLRVGYDVTASLPPVVSMNPGGLRSADVWDNEATRGLFERVVRQLRRAGSNQLTNWKTERAERWRSDG